MLDRVLHGAAVTATVINLSSSHRYDGRRERRSGANPSSGQ
jgi:hypothetical protein